MNLRLPAPATSAPSASSADPSLTPSVFSGAQPAVTVPLTGGTAVVWKNIVAGALAGLASSADATHFGGLAMGAKGVLEQKQREFGNKIQQQQLQVESLKA